MQHSLVKSLEDCKEALYSFVYCKDIDYYLKSVLLEIEFWAGIIQLLELLEPIYTLQKMSEDNKATISYVYPRWIKLEAYLKKIANSKSAFATDVKSYLETVSVDSILLTKLEKKNWTCLYKKQLLSLYRVAYYLHPSNSKAAISNTYLAEVKKFFEQYIPDYKLAFEQFFDFRNYEGNFADTTVAWGYTDHPKMFWNCQETSSPTLASFAKYLLTTIGNSILSEQAFSTINYIYSKTRNRLSPENAQTNCNISI
jgi:hypothetical protein